MAGDPAILKRIRACPFARRSGEPLARLRLAGNGDEVVLLYPLAPRWLGGARRLRRERHAASVMHGSEV